MRGERKFRGKKFLHLCHLSKTLITNSLCHHSKCVHFEVEDQWIKPVSNYKPVFNPFLSFNSLFENTEKSLLHHHSPIPKPEV